MRPNSAPRSARATSGRWSGRPRSSGSVIGPLSLRFALLGLLQSGQVSQVAYSGRDGQVRVPVPRLEGSPTIDGTLDEPEWAGAARLVGFSQYAPGDGRPPEDSTEGLRRSSSVGLSFVR